MVREWDILAFISMPGTWEWLVIAMLGLLIFGKRLPEVGKSLGKSIVEFKKGLKGVEDDIERAIDEEQQKDMLPPPQSHSQSAPDTHETVAAQAKTAAGSSDPG